MSVKKLYKPALIDRLLSFEPFHVAKMSSEARRLTAGFVRNSISFQCGSVEAIMESTDNAIFLYSDPAGTPFGSTWLEFTYGDCYFGVMVRRNTIMHMDASVPDDHQSMAVQIFCDPTCTNGMEPLDVMALFGCGIPDNEYISGFDDEREISEWSRKVCDRAVMGTRIILNYLNMPAVSYRQAKRPLLNKSVSSARKRRLYEHKVLVLDKSRISESIGPGGGGTHASPRAHLRRGHQRRLKSGGVIWINEMVVGDKSKGIITKDYDLST